MKLHQNRIVVKVGTSTLTNDAGKNNLRAFDRLACVLSDVQTGILRSDCGGSQ